MLVRTCGVLFLFASAAAFTLSPALTVTPLQAASSGKLSMSGAREVSIEVAPSAQNLGPTVLVAGATGRVGALVCQEVLLRITNSKVRAVFRNSSKADIVLNKLQNDYPNRLELVVCNLEKRGELSPAMQGVDQVVYCASGFRAPRGTFLQKIGLFLKLKLKQTFGRLLDIRGPALACKMLKKYVKTAPWTVAQANSTTYKQLPRMVMLSSAAVTRPQWDNEKRSQYQEAAEIAIVKLNPFNVLGTKLRGENRVRKIGDSVPYAIVRSTGINSTHPEGEFIVSSGDTLIGRINPKDLAVALATTLITPQATGKTVEVATKAPTGSQLFGTRGAKQTITTSFAKIPTDVQILEAENEAKSFMEEAVAESSQQSSSSSSSNSDAATNAWKT